MATELASAAELAPRRSLRDGVLGNLIDGEWAPSESREEIADSNPAVPEQVLVRVTRSNAADAQHALEVARAAQRTWADESPLLRAGVLQRAADLLRARASTVALALTLEEGKPLKEARGEVLRAAEIFEATAGLAYVGHGEVFARRRREQWLLTDHAPLGVVVVIAPWNFPLLIPAWKLAPALLAGNAVILKPAELTPLTAAHLADVLTEAGLPRGVLSLILGSGSALGGTLLRPPAAAVSFTGGNATGAAIARAAVDQHLKFQLELGGNNPVLVLADANVELAAREIIAGAISSTGQKCTATRRVFAEASVAGRLSAHMRAALGAVRLGPGVDAGTTVGPLVSAQARDDFAAAIERFGASASLDRFGTLPDNGHFARPVLATGGDPDAELFAEEVFGPLVSLFEIQDLQEGIRRCNDTPFGLSASLFSSRLSAALEFADRIDAGMVHINSQTTGGEPHLPFGGMKHSSSFSREVGRHGLDFFTQVKTVYMEGA